MRFGRYTLVTFCFLLFGALLIYPIILSIAGGFTATTPDGSTSFTAKYVLSVFTDPILRDGLFNSLLVATLVTLLSLAIAVPLAVLAVTYDYRGKAILSALLLIPLILPPFVGAIGLRLLLGRYGALNSALMSLGIVDPAHPAEFLGGKRLLGIVIMEALHLYPIIYLNASAALANIDSALEQAAENLGASRWLRFRRITLPLILPGLFAGGTIVFIWSFTELGTPLVFDFHAITPVQIFYGIQEMNQTPRPYALVAVMLAFAVLIYATSKFAFGGRSYAGATRAASVTTAKKLRGFPAALVALPFLIVTGLAVLPHLGVILASVAEPGTWYRSVLPAHFTGTHFAGALTHPLASNSIRNSLVYACLAMAVDLSLGLSLAWLIVRAKVWGSTLIDSLAMLPLAVPGLVLAFGYVAISLQITQALTRAGYAAPRWLQIVGENPDPILFLVIAYAIRRLPYVVRSATAGLQQISGDMEEASHNLGASHMTTLRRIVVPLIAANLIAGALLAFSFAMLEVSDSLILAQREEHYPITKAIYSLFERLGDGPHIASALGVWGMALLTITLVGASLMLGKKLGAIFRI